MWYKYAIAFAPVMVVLGYGLTWWICERRFIRKLYKSPKFQGGAYNRTIESKRHL